MNKLYYISFIFCISNYSFAQTNIVQNGSFEEFDSCYGNFCPLGLDIFDWSNCLNWSNPIASSSDLWCENPILGVYTPPDLSFTSGAYQYPRTGTNMAGIYYSSPGLGFENYKEYIQNKLLNPLQKGKNYELTFFINRANKDDFTCNFSNIGAHFSKYQLFSTTAYWLDTLGYSVKNEKTKYLDDTLDWIEIKLPYTSIGGEEFVTIGSFNSNYSNDIDFSNLCDTAGFGYTGGYFFIDDVSLFELPFSASFPNVITPNNDGINDIWEPNIVSGGNWEIVILNRWGNLITNLDSYNNVFTGIDFPDGVYFYRFTSKELPHENRAGFFHIIH